MITGNGLGCLGNLQQVNGGTRLSYRRISDNRLSRRSFSHQGDKDLGVEGFGDAAQQWKGVAAIASLLDFGW